jgi:hypothetical protein
MRLFLVLAIIFMSCNSNDTDNYSGENEIADSTFFYDPENIYIWSVNSDSLTKTKNPLIKKEYYHVDTIITWLNYKFPEIQIKKVRQSNDTLYTRIDDSRYLTQRMGSSGPQFYFATVFFNLTSIPGIRYINLNFEEGDHAGPGVLSPEDYKEYIEK